MSVPTVSCRGSYERREKRMSKSGIRQQMTGAAHEKIMRRLGKVACTHCGISFEIGAGPYFAKKSGNANFLNPYCIPCAEELKMI